ncbi:MAG TPA: hypothetical protein VHW71_07550 [Steroidobacteraceae bacterium]|jgi:hypothetical protein|nr:hypothetical protein [Steroidobacteraceae bacterium]
MYPVHRCSLTAFAALGAAAASMSGCGSADQAPGSAAQGSASSVMARQKAASTPDPCTLLSATEAATYVGTLSTPPFRANDDGAADAAGDACAYRGGGAVQLVIVRTGQGSAAAGRIVKEVPNIIGGALEKAGAGNLAATAHRVMADVPNGPWDTATWIPGGTLLMTKGDDGANIDVSGSSGKQDDAVAIARLIVPRFDHPLDYDGAKAAAALPRPKAHPASACDVVPQSAVEGAIGPLVGAPSAAPDGSKCSYQVSSAQGPRSYQIEYVWQGGTKNFNMLKNGMSSMGSMMGGGIPTAGMDSMKMDPNMSKMMGGLMNMVGGGGGAPGAATQVGFETDTNLQGPWDSAMLMHGTQLFAVKNDVMVAMDLKSADYEKAKALLAVVCSAI